MIIVLNMEMGKQERSSTNQWCQCMPSWVLKIIFKKHFVMLSISMRNGQSSPVCFCETTVVSGIEMDAYVESEVVKPLKLYCTGRTTVKICERIMGNIDLFKSVRAAY